MKIVIELLEKYIGTAFKILWQLVWRYVICPLKKLAFPVKDLRTGIKQSRMRYYRAQFLYGNGDKHVAYQEADSNGNVKGYYDSEGKRFFPEEQSRCSLLDGGKFQFPNWGRKDWSDIFNGDRNSGRWGISEK